MNSVPCHSGQNIQGNPMMGQIQTQQQGQNIQGNPMMGQIQIQQQGQNIQGNPMMGQIQIQQQQLQQQQQQQQQQQLQQQQQQMGMINLPPNQIVCNGNLTIPNRPPFMNVPNQFFNLQNAMRPPAQFFGSQNSNPVAMNNQIMNSLQQPVVGGGGGGQFFAQNHMNPMVPYNTQNFMLPNAQFHSPMNPIIPYNNQNVGLQNGGQQFCMQNPSQNMVQLVQMQMPNYAQVVPGNMQLFQNQVAHGMPPQNPNFPGNQQFGMSHSSGNMQHGNNQEQQKLISPMMGMTATNQSPNTGAQLQGNSSIQQNIGTVQPQQVQNFGPPGFTKPQGNIGNNGFNNVNTNGNNFHNKNFTSHPNNDASQRGFKPQFQHKQNGQGKTRFHDQHRGKGFNNFGPTNSNDANSTSQTRVERKPLRVIYTEHEVKQWCEARKKNFPSKANLNKKMAGDAELRRQQLKEILAKQAELGIEVAEIPSSYLSDSQQGHQKEGNKRERGKKGWHKNKFNKRGKLHQNGRFINKQNSGEDDPSNINNDENGGSTMKQQHLNRNYKTEPPVIKKEPTLLQKLLAADISRDKSHLLQVFRFMVANSFFKDWPNKPLRFPSVIIQETGANDEMVEERASPVENSINDSVDVDNDDNAQTNAQAHTGELNSSCAAEGCGEMKVAEPEEEEGEIID